jgi:hypothetical protein
LVSRVWEISSGICPCFPLAGGFCKFYANAGGKRPIQGGSDKNPEFYKYFLKISQHSRKSSYFIKIKTHKQRNILRIQ